MGRGEILDDFMWAMLVVGMLGLLLDFLVAKRGQKWIGDRLETGWLKLEYMRLAGIEREGAARVVEFIDRRLGGFVSGRRFLAIFLVMVGAMGVTALARIRTILSGDCQADGLLAAIIFMAAAALIFSISITFVRTAYQWVVRAATSTGTFLKFALAVLAQLVLVLYAAPVLAFLWQIAGVVAAAIEGPETNSLRELLRLSENLLRDLLSVLQLVREAHGALALVAQHFFGNGELQCTASIAAFVTATLLTSITLWARLLITIVFLLSHIVRPLVRGPVLLILGRIAEAERPVFTQVLGGLAAVPAFVHYVTLPISAHETVFDGFFWTVVGLGGLGLLVDFLLGRDGQKRLRDRLETWWYYFNEVQWRNLGQKEASLVLHIIDSRIGRLFSGRRILVSLTISVVIFTFIALWRFADALIHGCRFPVTATSIVGGIILVLYFTLSAAPSVFIAIAFTRSLSAWIARTSRTKLRTAMGFLVLFAVHVALLLYWHPVAMMLQTLFPGSLIVMFGDRNPIEVLAGPIMYLMSTGRAPVFTWLTLQDIFSFFSFQRKFAICDLQPSVQIANKLISVAFPIVRLLFSLMFLASFLSRPVGQSPISLLWARIVESEKPPFFLVLGGGGAIAKIAQEGIKRLAL